MKKILVLAVVLMNGAIFANSTKEKIIPVKKSNTQKIKVVENSIKVSKKQGDLADYCWRVQMDVKESLMQEYPNDPDFVNAVALGAFMGCMRG